MKSHREMWKMMPLRHCHAVRLPDREVWYNPKRERKAMRLALLRDARVFEAEAERAAESGNESLAANLRRAAAETRAKAMAMSGPYRTQNSVTPTRKRSSG